MAIKIIDGNLFDSKAQIICHQVNCQGVMGSGVAAEVKRRYPYAYQSYRWDYEDGNLELGYVDFVRVQRNQYIANMCVQDKYGYDGKQYTNYDALNECLERVADYAFWHYDEKCTVAFPYMLGCCRGGGDWNRVYKMIKNVFDDYDIDVELWRLDKG